MENLIGFEKLRVWKKSRNLAISIYKVTASERFPKEERFGLISQMRRASISIASNIAEGSGRVSDKDRIRFITIAFGSAVELLNQLIIAKELTYIEIEEFESLKVVIRDIFAMLSGLKNSIKQF